MIRIFSSSPVRHQDLFNVDFPVHAGYVRLLLTRATCLQFIIQQRNPTRNNMRRNIKFITTKHSTLETNKVEVFLFLSTFFINLLYKLSILVLNSLAITCLNTNYWKVNQFENPLKLVGNVKT